MYKTLFISISILIVGIFALKGFRTESQSEQKWNSSEALSDVISIYDKSAYRSFYSLEELRPYSIIQLKKTINMYEQSWIEPEKIVDMLVENEKYQLKDKIIEYMEALNLSKRKELVNRVKYWSIADSQFNFFKETLLFNNGQLLNVFYDIKEINPAFSQLNVQNSGNLDSLSAINKNKAINMTKNIIAEMEYSRQLQLYAIMYSHFSERVK